MIAQLCKQCQKILQPLHEQKQVAYLEENALGTKDLRTVSERTGQVRGYGYQGAGHFCSLRCGWRYAVASLDAKK